MEGLQHTVIQRQRLYMRAKMKGQSDDSYPVTHNHTEEYTTDVWAVPASLVFSITATTQHNTHSTHMHAIIAAIRVT